MPRSSQRAINLTIASEVSSRAWYEKKYEKPEWPGLGSGVTIGIGYDLGMATAEKITADWKGRVSDEMLAVMVSCAGIFGRYAQELLPSVRDKILIPWDQAMAVFLNRDVPEWEAAVLRAIPASTSLSPDCFGVLFDLAYNRGASFGKAGDRYTEMRQIKFDIQNGALARVATELRNMKRLWPSEGGLRDRCDARIKLWNSGLTSTAAAPDAHAPEENPDIVLAPTAPAANSHHAAGGAVVVATAGAAKEAANTGHSVKTIVAIVLAGIMAAAIVWLVLRHEHGTPTTAREKDRPQTP